MSQYTTEEELLLPWAKILSEKNIAFTSTSTTLEACVQKEELGTLRLSLYLGKEQEIIASLTGLTFTCKDMWPEYAIEHFIIEQKYHYT